MLSVWYSLIYVVVEGYRELKCEDEAVDALLSHNELVEALRRFRNAIFHYQQDPMSEKLTKFLNTPESEAWLRALNEAFKQFFFRAMNIEKFAKDFDPDADWKDFVGKGPNSSE